MVLGSRSTDLRAEFGGLDGRALRDGDELPLAKSSALAKSRMKSLRDSRVSAWSVQKEWSRPARRNVLLRFVRGTDWNLFAESTHNAFAAARFVVTPEADRMGVRLDGPELKRNETHDLLSEAVASGTLQVPPNGKPILLLGDCQTIGGYPKIAHVITVDLPIAAQLRPGDEVRFQETSVSEAHSLLIAARAGSRNFPNRSRSAILHESLRSILTPILERGPDTMRTFSNSLVPPISPADFTPAIRHRSFTRFAPRMNSRSAVGAHPSFPDRGELRSQRDDAAGGRTPCVGDISAWRLSRLVRAAGTTMNHVKAHGALYNMAARDRSLAEVIANAVFAFDPKLILFVPPAASSSAPPVNADYKLRAKFLPIAITCRMERLSRARRRMRLCAIRSKPPNG